MTVDAEHAAPHGGDPIFAGDTQIGSVTSSGHGARTNKTICYGFVSADADLSSLSVGILGERFDALALSEALYDPANENVRNA